MMQKRTRYSLLLISFILVFAFSLSAQTVVVEHKDLSRCQTSLLEVNVTPSGDASAVEMVFVVTSDAGGAFFSNLSVNWDAGFSVLTHRVEDFSGVDYASPDTIRLAAILVDNGDACLAGSVEQLVATLSVTTNDVCSGEVTIAGGTFICPSFTVASQFASCDGTALEPAAVTSGGVTITNDPPTLAAIADGSIPWGQTFTTQAVGDDPDLAGGCEVLKYSILSGPAAMTIDSLTGAISWQTSGIDVCSHLVEVQVADGCGELASTSFNVCVTNEAPTIACPDDMMIGLGDAVSAAINGADGDSGPSPLAYSLIGWDGPTAASVSSEGLFTWETFFDPIYQGTWTATVAVSDGANTCEGCAPRSADTCSFSISVVNFLVAIDKTHGTIQGQQVQVDIIGGINEYEDSIATMGGFDLLVEYDASALSFQYAEAGYFLEACGWEYFTYRYGPNGNCGTGCPTGQVRLVAIAETNNGPNHPDCFATDDAQIDGDELANQLVKLFFLVTNDRTFECQYAPVKFVWYDCGDNTISSKVGNHLFISKSVYNFESSSTSDTSITGDISDLDADFPSVYGANSTCDIAEDTTDAGVIKPVTYRFITFVNGGVDIVCADSIDARGDLNLNEIPYEIADAVLYSRYFVYGLGVFTINDDGQIAASDVNADGLSLSVADLVYLIRVVIGDASPYAKEVVPGNISYVHRDGVVEIQNGLEVGAANIVVKGDVAPELIADNMEIMYNYDGANTRILVYSLEGNSFSGEMIRVNSEIVSIDIADDLGNPVTAKWIPSSFALNQNYPNPFNPTTTLSFMLPVKSDYNIGIFNINGQKVHSISGAADAGVVELEWDASAMASGVYFYRLNAGDFSDVKKMVLLK